jgi:hypothetical protein
MADIFGLAGDVGVDQLGLDAPNFNAVKSSIQTMVSRIAANMPRITFLTDGGTFSQKRKAQLLEQFNDGIFYQTKLYRLAPKCFLDSAIARLGALYAYFDPDTEQLCAEQVPYPELRFDDLEANRGYPHQVYRVRTVSREFLLAEYPDKEDLILAAQTEGRRGIRTGLTDLVSYIEAWHIRSGEKYSDGRWSVSISNGELDGGEYDYDYLPFCFLRVQEEPFGFLGASIVEDSASLQRSLDRTMAVIEHSLDICGKPMTFIPDGCDLVVDKLSDGIGAVIRMTGPGMPIIQAAQVVNPEQFKWQESITEAIYNQGGVSTLSATAEKPAGLNSGEAIKTYRDTESLRFAMMEKHYDNFFMDCAEMFINMMRDHEDVAVKVPLKGALKQIKWKQINLDRSDFTMEMYPTNLLPKEPAGRLDKLEQMSKTGVYSMEELRELSNFPDLKAVDDLASASLEYAAYVIDCLAEGKAIAPEPFEDLAKDIPKVQAALLRGMTMQMPEKIQNAHRVWISQAMALQAQAQQAAAPAMPPAVPGAGFAGPPTARGAPAPISPLLPQQAPPPTSPGLPQ